MRLQFSFYIDYTLHYLYVRLVFVRTLVQPVLPNGAFYMKSSDKCGCFQLIYIFNFKNYEIVKDTHLFKRCHY